jgi:hypothetical protein
MATHGITFKACDLAVAYQRLAADLLAGKVWGEVYAQLPNLFMYYYDTDKGEIHVELFETDDFGLVDNDTQIIIAVIPLDEAGNIPES